MIKRKRICFLCVNRVLDPKDSGHVSGDDRGWQCKAAWWQDETVCLKTNGGHWASRCSDFELLEEADV